MRTVKRKTEILVIAVFLACVIWEIITYIYTPKQSYLQALLESWYFKNGLLFYKDVASAYTPLLKFLMYVFHQVFGYGMNQTLVLPLIASLVILTILYLMGRKWSRGLSRIAPLIFYEIWSNYLGTNMFSATEFLGFLILLSFICWLAWWKKPQRTLALISGLLFSFSVLTIQIVAPFIAILSLFVLIKSIKLKKISHFIYLLVGMLTPVLVLFYWAWTNHMVNEFLYWNVFYYFGGYPYAMTKDVSMILALIAIHSPLVIYSLTLPRKGSGEPFVFIIISIATLIATFWFSVLHPLRFQISLPIMAFLLGMGFENYLSGRATKLKNFIFGLALGSIISCLVLYIIPRFLTALSTRNISRNILEIYPGDPMFDAVNWVKDNTPQDSKIFVLGDGYFYYAAKRLPASYRNAIGNEPWLFLPLEKFRQEIIAKQPDYWIVDERMYLTYSNLGRDNLSQIIKQFVSCQTVIKRFDYWTISKPDSGTLDCISKLKFQ